MDTSQRTDYSTTPRYRQFAEDMEEAGYEVSHYRGRFYYEGPSVTVPHEELQDVMRATSVRVQWDDMGKSDYVVYPR